MPTVPEPVDHDSASLPTRAVLVSDCSRCTGLCCVALPFAATADFALDKAAGVPCPNLGVDHRCGIHERLPEEGFAGCVAYECFGAGQRVAQVTFRGRDWRQDPAVAEATFAAFRSLRPLHEVLWYLAEALELEATAPLHDELRARVRAVDAATTGGPAEVATIDVDQALADSAKLLRRVSTRVRAEAPGPAVDLAGADLFGADLRSRDLRAADLRGACLIGADLRRVDLGRASVIGADLRGADLRGADLAGVLFLTQAQVTSARGDATTRLPPALLRPDRWNPAVGGAGRR